MPRAKPKAAGKAKSPARQGTKAPKILSKHMAGLAAVIAGKDKVAELLPFSDDRVLGHVKRVVSTRSIALDKCTRINGFPCGRVVELYGLNGSGKTTACLQLAAQTQAMGGEVIYIDTEDKLDLSYARRLGVDPDRMLILQPRVKSLESVIQAVSETLTYWIDQGLTDVPITVIWDSVGGTASLEELENPGSKQPGVAARGLKQAMRTLTESVAKARALLLLTNHLYEKIGVFGPGVKRTTSGGEGIRYQATMRVEFIRIGTLKIGDHPVGIEVLVKFLKNHAGSLEGAPTEDVLLESLEETIGIQYAKGISNGYSLYEKLKEHRYITGDAKSATYAVKGGRTVTWRGGWHGLDQLLATDQELLREMGTLFMALR